MNNSFPRIITLLRKEKGYSQKKVAQDLGVSQALLSHYEKGIRECGLDFVVKISDYYNVSSDYILGRTPDRQGTFLKVEDLPDENALGKENTFKGSLLPTLNKKLLINSLNIIFDLLSQMENKNLINDVSSYLMVSVYKMFRILYSSNSENPQGIFAIPQQVWSGLALAAQSVLETNSNCLASGEKLGKTKGLEKNDLIELTPQIISAKYPKFAASLYNLIQNAEGCMGAKRSSK